MTVEIHIILFLDLDSDCTVKSFIFATLKFDDFKNMVH